MNNYDNDDYDRYDCDYDNYYDHYQNDVISYSVVLWHPSNMEHSLRHFVSSTN